MSAAATRSSATCPAVRRRCRDRLRQEGRRSTALAAVVGYLVVEAVFKTMSPIVLAGEVDKAGEQAQINYSVFAGIVVGLLTAWLFDRYHTIQLPSYLGFFGGRRFVPIVVSLASLFLAFAMSYFYPIFDAGLTGLGEFIGGAGASARSSTASPTAC